MATINQLNAVSNPSQSDLIAIYSTSNGDARKLSMGNLLEWIRTNILNTMTEWTTVRTVPGDGGSYTLPNVSSNIWFIIQPISGLSTFSVTLPYVSYCSNGQEIKFSITQQIASLTVVGNGAVNLYGVPTIIGADDTFCLKFDTDTNSWYRA
ncbi:hypothetical protein UFOVP81_27 [uncultured Caudovirales phage]|uniref:Uncharacterized protein n=1 Tax=uncultured Caudovirales phage TaxID=2100421 RepID=A0A6J5L497_9CAUD|nr:hypothetical protein UFOVP81_27 [uncultured Caudovirales phage]